MISSGVSRAVSIRMGVSPPSRRKRCTTDRPSKPGNITSSTMTSNSPACAAARPSEPSNAAVAACPNSSKPFFNWRASLRSSSTIRICMGAVISFTCQPEEWLSSPVPVRLLRKSSDLRATIREMRTMGIWVAGILLMQSARSEVVRFDGAAVGSLPAGWSVAMTHAGAPPRWEIVRDASAPHPPLVLAQTSHDDTAGRFPLAIWDRAVFRDGEISVAFKAVSGNVDRAAGIVWRYQDPNNYYIVRANALENNVVLYKVEKGVRLSLVPKGLPSRAYGVKHEVLSGQWNRLRVVFQESLFTVFFNGEQLFQVEDQSIRHAGKTGLWTKADSLTYFADFTVVKH